MGYPRFLTQRREVWRSPADVPVAGVLVPLSAILSVLPSHAFAAGFRVINTGTGQIDRVTINAGSDAPLLIPEVVVDNVPLAVGRSRTYAMPGALPPAYLQVLADSGAGTDAQIVVEVIDM